jgi:hypothetical protein
LKLHLLLTSRPASLAVIRGIFCKRVKQNGRWEFMNNFSFTSISSAAEEPVAGINNPDPTANPPANAGADAEPLKKSAQNLLLHIPGEASGLYLMAADAFEKPTSGTIIFIAISALIILILVRWLAGASRAVMMTSIAAFLIWMFVLDKGAFHILFPALLPNPLGLIIAVVYSTIITLLANAGKIK